MNILVMGGSYFLGRYFISLDNNNITVFNRGNCEINLPNVKEIKGDRHDANHLLQLKDYDFDVVVDFCAYNKGDIEAVLQALKNKPKQYIFISTVDVYERNTGGIIDEDGKLESRIFEGEAGAYIAGKVSLEKEIKEVAAEYGINYTVIRPAFIYGPGNYAPREGIYFNWIKQAGQILHPLDADGEWQMVYVGDVAKAICQAIGNENCYNEAYNLTGEKMENYDSFAECLKKVIEVPFEKVEIPVELVYEKAIPLPFPLTKAETNCYNGDKALQLIGNYTCLEDGMRDTVSSVFSEN